MNLLKPISLFCLTRNFSKTVISSAVWNRDWKPKKFPETEEEKAAAAKKYGLFPEEYRPTPDDGEGIGDYPHIKPISSEGRDPFYPWDYPDYRRNYGEVMHPDYNIYTPDRMNLQKPPMYPISLPKKLVIALYLIMLVLMFLYVPDINFQIAARELPASGIKHYHYEPPSSS